MRRTALTCGIVAGLACAAGDAMTGPRPSASAPVSASSAVAILGASNAGNAIRRIRLGANRNLGATELMHVWWDDVEVWTDQTGAPAGWPAFSTPTRY